MKTSTKQFLNYGLPFLTLVVGGSFGLMVFTQNRYTYSKKRMIKPEDAEKLDIEMKKPGEVTLESEFEKLKELDIDNWESVRAPRPWEENTLPSVTKKNILNAEKR